MVIPNYLGKLDFIAFFHCLDTDLNITQNTAQINFEFARKKYEKKAFSSLKSSKLAKCNL